MLRAYHSASFAEFLQTDPAHILGRLTQEHAFDLTGAQRDAWLAQGQMLRQALTGRQGTIHLEFSVPRMGRRMDAVVLIGPVVFILEFKVGAERFLAGDVDQVMDYALDMRNFHEGSHRAVIAPVLVATSAPHPGPLPFRAPGDGLFAPLRTNAHGLSATLDAVLGLVSGPPLDPSAWANAAYKPTPTIIEATLALYRGHAVSEISRSDAGAVNLSITSSTVARVIGDTRARAEKAVVFVTGVPGSGKTLVGLNIATTHLKREDELYSVFLSGNGPLVAVLQEALARDRQRRALEQGNKLRKGEARSEVKAFIQNVHHFRDEGLIDLARPPVEHVALFDEAQRAWDLPQTVDFMRRKKNQPDFDKSEPEFLISCMDRHRDWAVVVCLVGGGQEINTGEAGIGEWLSALERSFPRWKIYVSGDLSDSEYSVQAQADRLCDMGRAVTIPELHLRSSVRSFRSERVSLLVRQLLDLEEKAARDTLVEVCRNYPLVLTRDLATAKRWLRERARGSERYGLVVSSQAERLRPYAIHVKAPMNPVHWFLDGKDDVRSSYYLEDVATEFDVQGLELDWACVVWDADFRHSSEGWRHWAFKGRKWQRIHKQARQRYQMNAYRVLLTRARQGMVLVVPQGDEADPTRRPEFYDETYGYLRRLGVEEL